MRTDIYRKKNHKYTISKSLTPHFLKLNGLLFRKASGCYYKKIFLENRPIQLREIMLMLDSSLLSRTIRFYNHEANCSKNGVFHIAKRLIMYKRACLQSIFEDGI